MNHQHLRRLDEIWLDQPIFFVTTCTLSRRRELDNDAMHAICREVWQNCEHRYGWLVGRYVLMPDHAHFFCAPLADGHPMSTFLAKWKEWTSKYAQQRQQVVTPLWQPEFFDRLLRSAESYEEKWMYVVQNPVRAGLVATAEAWPYQGEMNALRLA